MVTNRIVPSAHIIHLFSEERNIFLFLVDKAQSLVYCIHIQEAQNEYAVARSALDRMADVDAAATGDGSTAEEEDAMKQIQKLKTPKDVRTRSTTRQA